MDRLRDALVRLSYLPQTLRLAWSAARGWTAAWSVLLVLQGLLPVAVVHLVRALVDTLVGAVQKGGSWESLQPTLLLIALMGGVVLLTELLQSLGEWIRAAQSEFIQDHLSALVHEKSIAVDMAFYESPEYYDRLYQARDDAGNRVFGLLENSGSLVQNSITFAAMAAVLIPYGAWLPAVLLATTVPTFYVVLRFNRRYHRWWEQTTPDRRRIHYYDLLLTHSASAGEVRLFALGGHFQAAFQALRHRLRSERLELIRSQNLVRLGAGAGGLGVSGAAMAWMVWRALQGQVSLGDLTLFYQAFNRGQSLVRSLWGNIGQLYNNSLFLGKLFEFLALEPQIATPPRPRPLPAALREGIHFRQVTFRYPGSARPALQDFELRIPAGQIAAIVGANGAGKSTLAKLLTRFYDPQEGCIELDGVDIRQVPLEQLRRLFTVLFQFPVFYQDTVRQNIALGDLAAAPGLPEVERAAHKAGAQELIARLPRGYDTPLGKWFAGGTELSGGEWQRIALARAFLRQAQVIILDEPTSFMDSWAELDWLKRFRTLAEGRTALVITHRFTTAMRADVIYVMENGRIAEAGSHDELLAQNGLYAQSWTAQVEAGQQCRRKTLEKWEAELVQTP